MQEQYPSITPELQAQPSAELAYEETSNKTTEKLEAMRRMIDETYADLLNDDEELAAEVAAMPEIVEEEVASPEVLTHKDRAERIGRNLAHIRKDR